MWGIKSWDDKHARNRNTTPMLARAIRIFALLAAAGSLGLMVHEGDFSSPEQMVAAVAFACWIALPYVLAWFAAGRLVGHIFALLVLGAGLIAATGFGYFIYASAFIFTEKPDAQAGLAFLAVPLYQLGAVLLATALAFVAKAVSKRR
ncbi:MAG: hypothetical protein ACR2PM_01350 [Hyphomicrobiales bacterium]